MGAGVIWSSAHTWVFYPDLGILTASRISSDSSANMKKLFVPKKVLPALAAGTKSHTFQVKTKSEEY